MLSEIIFAIGAMLSWGFADFLAANAVRKVAVLKIFFWVQLLGLFIISLLFLSSFNFPSLSLYIILILLFSGFLRVAAFFSFYKGLRVGKASIVSPLSSCWAVVTVILSLTFLHEKLSFSQNIGIILAIMGAVLASFKWSDLIGLKIRKFESGIKYAVIAALGFGISGFLFNTLADKFGWFISTFLIQIAMVLYIMAYALPTKKDVKFPKNVGLFIIIIAILEVIGLFSYMQGIATQYTAITAPISSASPIVVVILARIFFKEKLEINQMVGVASILGSLILLSL